MVAPTRLEEAFKYTYVYYIAISRIHVRDELGVHVELLVRGVAAVLHICVYVCMCVYECMHVYVYHI